MRTATLVVWGLLALAAVALEVLGRRGVAGFVPLGAPLRALRASAVWRGVLLVAWMWLGWHLFAR